MTQFAGLGGAIRVGDAPADVPRGARVPSVDFGRKDLQDSSARVTEGTIARDYARKAPATVYRAFIPAGDMPTPRGSGIEDGRPVGFADPDEDGEAGEDYDWDELRSTHHAFPPAKVLRDAKGELHIQDGNHRIAWWLENDYSFIPAWVVDEQRYTPPDDEDEDEE